MKFIIEGEEKEALKLFHKNHSCTPMDAGAIGGHVTYSFTPTSIGTAIIVQCGVCKKVMNITDYESW